MGVTLSHTTLAPISLASTIIGFISFAFTLGTFLKVFWSSIITLYGAPKEINDFLSNLKQGLLEERRHLRRVKRRLKTGKRDGSHVRGGSRSDDDPGGGGGGRRRSGGGAGHGSRAPSRGLGRGRRKRGKEAMYFDRDLQSFNSKGEDASLESMRMALRDMIKQFRRIEHPFLKAEFQNQSSSDWSTSAPYPYTPEKPPPTSWRSDTGRDRDEDYDDWQGSHHLQRTNRLGMEYQECGFRERWLWLRRKDEVIRLLEMLSRIEVRRTAHEVGEVLVMCNDIGKDLEDVRESILALEGRMSRVVGVRRVD